MKARTALLIIFIVSICGVLFSGYLSYSELFAKTCPIGGCQYVLGAPSCVYGFIMYTVVFLVSGSSLFLNREREVVAKE
jgi:hypothetical protein